jgi:branched-subunit amino acid transport protein
MYSLIGGMVSGMMAIATGNLVWAMLLGFFTVAAITADWMRG